MSKRLEKQLHARQHDHGPDECLEDSLGHDGNQQPRDDHANDGKQPQTEAQGQVVQGHRANQVVQRQANHVADQNQRGEGAQENQLGQPQAYQVGHQQHAARVGQHAEEPGANAHDPFQVFVSQFGLRIGLLRARPFGPKVKEHQQQQDGADEVLIERAGQQREDECSDQRTDDQEWHHPPQKPEIRVTAIDNNGIDIRTNEHRHQHADGFFGAEHFHVHPNREATDARQASLAHAHKHGAEDNQRPVERRKVEAVKIVEHPLIHSGPVSIGPAASDLPP